MRASYIYFALSFQKSDKKLNTFDGRVIEATESSISDRREMSQKHVVTDIERIAVTETGIGLIGEQEKKRLKQENKKSKQIKNLDIGRILIKEIHEEKKHIPKVPDKKIVKPKTVEVTKKDQRIQQSPVTQLKEKDSKAGKLDVYHLQNEFIDSRTVKEKIKSYTDEKPIRATIENVIVTKAEVKNTKELKTTKYSKHLDIGRIVIEEIPDKKEPGSKETNLREEQLLLKTTEVKIAQLESEKQREQRPRYVKGLDVGLIVIEEYPEEKEKALPVLIKERVKSKSIDMALPMKNVLKIPGEHIAEDIVKVGKISKEQTHTISKEQTHKTTMQEKTEYSKTINELESSGRRLVEYAPAQAQNILKSNVSSKPQLEPTLTEVTITQHKNEEERQERRKHVKALDVGRIVIEEIPDEKRKAPPVAKKENVRPKSVEITLPEQEVKEIPRRDIIEDVVKVGKLDVTNFEKKSLKSSRVQERSGTFKDWTHGMKSTVPAEDGTTTKKLEKSRYLKEVGRIMVEEISPEDEDMSKPDVLSKEQLRPKSIELSIAQHEIEEEREKVPRYVKALDHFVGRIVIDEIPKEKKKAPRLQKNEKVRPKSVEVIIHDQDIEEFSRENITLDDINVGKLDVFGLEKQSMKSSAVLEKTWISNDMTHKDDTKTKITTRDSKRRGESLSQNRNIILKPDVSTNEQLDAKDLEKEMVESRTVKERTKNFSSDTVDGIRKVFLLISNETDVGCLYLTI